jgi:MHS family shikimate/dehydroshikimate transporter-like MFS transporter
MASEVNAGARPGGSSVGKVAAASFIGTTIEWYDFFLYGTVATLVFDKLFFPTISGTAATLAALSTYAAGFVARPIGGIIFGHYGDRVGRKQMLVISILLMGVASLLIGFLPTYATLGVAAPVLLVVLRVVQGIGVGGEWGGAVLMSTEYAPRGKRGLYGSFPQMGVPAGLLLSTVVVLITSNSMSDAAFNSYGWRIPFLFSFVLVGVGLYIRLSIMESPAFQQVKETKAEASIPLVETVRRHPKALLTSMGARIGENALFYIFTVFILEYGTEELGLERGQILPAVVIAAAIGLFTTPFYGALSDRLGRRPVYLFGAGLSLVFSFVYFGMVDTKSIPLIILATVIGLNVGHDAMYGPQAAFFAESFSTRTRFTGASIGYQLAAVFGGGIAPLVAVALLAAYGSFAVAVYMAAMCLITIVAVYAATETYEADIEEAVESPGTVPRAGPAVG